MSLMQRPSSQQPVVVDASVAVKWYLHDEDLWQQSRTVREDLAADPIAVVVPGHFQIEVGNAVRNALRPRRLTLDAARLALATVDALPVQAVPLADLIIAGFEAALHFNCALYDALYLALADQIGCAFVHADRRLHNTLGGRFPRELWIEDYAAR